MKVKLSYSCSNTTNFSFHFGVTNQLTFGLVPSYFFCGVLIDVDYVCCTICGKWFPIFKNQINMMWYVMCLRIYIQHIANNLLFQYEIKYSIEYSTCNGGKCTIMRRWSRFVLYLILVRIHIDEKCQNQLMWMLVMR